MASHDRFLQKTVITTGMNRSFREGAPAGLLCCKAPPLPLGHRISPNCRLPILFRGISVILRQGRGGKGEDIAAMLPRQHAQLTAGNFNWSRKNGAAREIELYDLAQSLLIFERCFFLRRLALFPFAFGSVRI
jgi:hypothetical protein